MKSPSLFPEIDKAIADDRMAAKREQVQHARRYLKQRDFSWLINHLLEHGPKTEHCLMQEAMQEEYVAKEAVARAGHVLADLYSLWTVRKLWRQSQGIHPGSGQETFLYGIRGVHPK